ncbi:MAG: GvpL/GvpF family gas vesicle protein [Chloroflexi bacterium]|nr:GvpL/GvpF family gas vesicle protein [Chloroflexota bacterium]
MRTLPCAGVSGAPVSVITHHALAAVVSAVSTTEFGPEALPGKLEDARWVAASALIHHRVLVSLLGRCTVAPLQFGTLCRDAGAVGEMVDRHYRQLDEALARVHGATEWDVKLSCDRRALLEHLGRTHPRLRRMADDAAALSEGAAFFVRRSADECARQEVDTLVAAHALEARERLTRVARAAVARAVPPATRPGGSEIVLHEAYLVADEDRERFFAAVAALRCASGSSGLTFGLNGPWPAYSFVQLGPDPLA